MSEAKKFPYSLEAEKYILGCMMLDPSIVDQVLTEIKSDDFHVQSNKNVMDAIETLVKNGESVDQLNVYNE